MTPRRQFCEDLAVAISALIASAKALDSHGNGLAADVVRKYAADLSRDALPLAPEPTAEEFNEALVKETERIREHFSGTEEEWIGRSLVRVMYATTPDEVDEIVTGSIEAKVAGIDW